MRSNQCANWGWSQSGQDTAIRSSTFLGMRALQWTQAAVLLCIMSRMTWSDDAGLDSFFLERVAPILERHCLACHNDADKKGSISFQSYASLEVSGAVLPGDAEESPLLLAVSPMDGEPAMPKDRPPLSADEIKTLRVWIDRGANWPNEYVLKQPSVSDFDWWSFHPLKTPEIPVIDHDWVRTPIDAFILKKLLDRNWTPNPETDRRTLLRRVTYDLIGLPPTYEEVQAFLNDPDPQAYEKVVDRLLASPRYGERWAQHWLDIVKYADTCGYDKDKLRLNAWPYRDYVIRSLNTDKPYSQFVREQVAGDVLYPGNSEAIVALGFIAAGPWDFIGHVEVPESKIDGKVARNLDRDDMVSNTINTFCSLTVQCARCHHHKFDPITQEDYYGLQAVFAAVDRAERPYAKDEQIERRRAELAQEIAERRARAASLTDEAARAKEQAEIEARENELKNLPEGKLVYAAASHFRAEGNFQPTEGKLRSIFVLHRGEVQQPGAPAIPGFLPLRLDDDCRISDAADDAARRAALANWLTDRDHPLVWRSIVNRVWQYHFGTGIVATPNDFGRMGSLPSHLELLNWLACSFRDGEQSIKDLHRMIVTSSVYRQSSAWNSVYARSDAGNQFLWRMPRRRLDAEEIRDSMLAASGSLNLQMYGPGFYLFELEKTEHSPHYEYHKFDPGNTQSHRRSIYRFVVRSQPDPWMTVLDCADSSQSTPKRNETLTSLQALALLNSPFTVEVARRLAERVELAAPDADGRMIKAFEWLLQRKPSDDEIDLLRDYANKHGMVNLCRFLWNINEFVYVD